MTINETTRTRKILEYTGDAEKDAIRKMRFIPTDELIDSIKRQFEKILEIEQYVYVPICLYQEHVKSSEYMAHFIMNWNPERIRIVSCGGKFLSTALLDGHSIAFLDDACYSGTQISQLTNSIKRGCPNSKTYAVVGMCTPTCFHVVSFHDTCLKMETVAAIVSDSLYIQSGNEGVRPTNTPLALWTPEYKIADNRSVPSSIFRDIVHELKDPPYTALIHSSVCAPFSETATDIADKNVLKIGINGSYELSLVSDE
jgi:hypothetical protein